jgi:hypothetical protein
LIAVCKTQAPRPESPISLCWTLDATQQSSARRRDRPPRRCSLGVTRRRDQVIAAGPALIHGSVVTVRDLPGRAHLGVCNFGIKGKAGCAFHDREKLLDRKRGVMGQQILSRGSDWVLGLRRAQSPQLGWRAVCAVAGASNAQPVRCDLECASSLSDACKIDSRNRASGAARGHTQLCPAAFPWVSGECACSLL